MVLSVLSMLKPVRMAAADHLEELAARFAAGEPVAPEETEVILDRLRASESDLQAAIKRQTHNAEARRVIADSDKWEKRLAEIEAEYAVAERSFVKARDAYNALLLKHHEEHQTCRFRLEDAEAAKRSLMREENLPPSLAARLRDARKVCSEAADQRDAAAHELRVRQGRLQQALDELPGAEHAARTNPTIERYAEAMARLETTLTARRELVAEAERLLKDAEARCECAVAKRTAVEREIAAAMIPS